MPVHRFGAPVVPSDRCTLARFELHSDVWPTKDMHADFDKLRRRIRRHLKKRRFKLTLQFRIRCDDFECFRGKWQRIRRVKYDAQLRLRFARQLD